MWIYLKAAVAVVTGLWLIFYIPRRARDIATGWVPANFRGSPADYPAYWAKKSIRFMCFAMGISIVLVVLAVIGTGPADWIPDLAVAAIWLVIAGVTYRARRQISAART